MQLELQHNRSIKRTVNKRNLRKHKRKLSAVVGEIAEREMIRLITRDPDYKRRPTAEDVRIATGRQWGKTTAFAQMYGSNVITGKSAYKVILDDIKA